MFYDASFDSIYNPQTEIDSVLTHTQANFCDQNLGTQVKIDVSQPFKIPFNL